VSVEPEIVWLRPERAGVGRPAQRSRSEITAAAVALADRDGLDAVSMRNVAAELGTAGGSLYRYVTSHGELLDLMADHVAAEYSFGAPTGNWLDDLVDVGLLGRDIHRRHPWLAEVVTNRPGAGPNGIGVLEHVLAVLADHPADDGAKLTAFAVMNAVVVALAQNERATANSEGQTRFMTHIVAEGKHPHLAALRLPPADPYEDVLPDVLRRILTGLLQ
jgi:AcrR family transcriptional regulator